MGKMFFNRNALSISKKLFSKILFEEKCFKGIESIDSFNFLAISVKMTYDLLLIKSFI